MIAVLVLLLGLASCAGRDSAPLPGPRLVFEETAHDLGPVEPGAPAKYSFALRNQGGRVLRLDNLRAGCGCRASAVPGDAVQAGESAWIEIACDTAALAGAEERTVTVYSNDALHPAVTLRLDLVVAADIAPAQPEFYFGTARRGEQTDRDIRLRLRDAAAVPRGASSEGGQFDARIERRGGDEWRVALTVSPQAPAGVVRDRVIIETASAKQPRLVVPVVGTVGERGAGEGNAAVRTEK